MQLDLDLQITQPFEALPNSEAVEQWVKAALMAQSMRESFKQAAELTIRIVDNQEIASLNSEYRNKQGPTNVLSFPADLPEEVELPLLGDIIISAPKVAEEATQQQKPLEAHWAHMVVHGTLHLIGYDHIEPEEADIMEALETKILLEQGFSAPYQEPLKGESSQALEPPSPCSTDHL